LVFYIYGKEYSIYSLQGSQNPREKKKQTLRKILAPPNEGVPNFLLGLDTEGLPLLAEQKATA